jgi:peptidyl-prolyl cis-trans isomerase A (cyclophilin A)
MDNGLYAKFNTSKGEILVNLEYQKAPMTVANFVGLAKGEFENTAVDKGVPYYDGMKFHRVIENFMIQGGCPQGTGVGGPGYQFADEFHPDLRHSGPGVLSMANAGPGTNGSQFFITHVETPWLDDKHTVFGNVIKGQDVVDAIVQNDTLDSLEIIAVGDDAKSFNAKENFEAGQQAEKDKAAKEVAAIEEKLKKYTANATKTDSGLFYEITEKGSGSKPTKGQTVSVHYAGYLLNGQKFDSSFDRNQPIQIPIGAGQVIPGWDEGIMLLNEGDKARLIIPPHLGYGSAGAGGVIPPNATLIFEVQLVKLH